MDAAGKKEFLQLLALFVPGCKPELQVLSMSTQIQTVALMDVSRDCGGRVRQPWNSPAIRVPLQLQHVPGPVHFMSLYCVWARSPAPRIRPI